MNPAPYNVQHTILWQRLNTGFPATGVNDASILASNVATLCAEVSNRMRSFPSLHPQYTLHDEVHLLRVTELMALVMPAEVLQALNPVEITLLILAAHFHDQGMVPDATEFARWREDSPNPDPAFVLHRQNWALDHPNLEAVRRQLNDPTIDEREKETCRRVEADLLSAMLSDYLRITHGQRSAQLLRTNYGSDPRLLVQGASLTDALARLCESHVGPVPALTEANGFRVDERIGVYSVNLVYLALILRLADILDFDRERTPDSLYRSIDLRSPISLTEWAKHRAVVGWTISPDAVQFTMECEHPAYERAANRFMDYIDEELQNATQRVREFPQRAAHYRLDLPIKTDRSRIKPKDNAYIYHDLEFSLSRDEVVKLLMTDKLYGSPSLCVRELLQNSLDALRHRKALFQRDGLDWQLGEVQMLHEVDAHGHEVLHCIDNGVGMNRDIILNFLTKAGRSYYRSPLFEQERIGLRAAGVDFDPCAQFGIGFMSCFMLGDHIVIQTRRDKGLGQGHDEPLIVEINGLGGIVVLRSGDANQPIGTTITITGRKKPRFMDTQEDIVRLIPILKNYALATEFAIKANCTVENIAATVSIPSVPAISHTLPEILGLKMFKTLEQDFSELNSMLSGVLRASFLVDDKGEYVLANEEACWEKADKEYYDQPTFQLQEEDKEKESLQRNYNTVSSSHDNSPIALDGILVTGRGGREDLLPRGMPSNRFNAGTHYVGSFNTVFLLDIRGNVKPPLTPARQAPVSYGFSTRNGRWGAIANYVNMAEGRIWEIVAQDIQARFKPELFWQLGLIYTRFYSPFQWMRLGKCWEHLSFPVLGPDKTPEWRPVADLGLLEIVELTQEQEDDMQQDFILCTTDAKYIGTYAGITDWGMWDAQEERDGIAQPSPFHINTRLNFFVILLATLDTLNNKVVLRLLSPTSPNTTPAENILMVDYHENLAAINYSESLQSFLSVHAICRTSNRNHPILNLAIQSSRKDRESLNDFERFTLRLISCLSNSNNSDELKSPADTMSRQYRELGARFLDLDWSRIQPQYHPPYKIRLLDGTSVDITREVFESWANAKPLPEEE
ncbi:hypothetical protein Q5H93_04345 [Hymenobacter sp. ASUV-10]|uniref:HD-CE domain-containing protein n=1 Tax=Hymenobacter aranciens TaxID=3063996 RepID=A0ABT9B8G8_9BACT|nr:hypothetical protein [Hymenobacter sp. ASUV-10]MDO7873953.1 hypothetical protein [Hymenobacter sp. ASUV-10]